MHLFRRRLTLATWVQGCRVHNHGLPTEAGGEADHPERARCRGAGPLELHQEGEAGRREEVRQDGENVSRCRPAMKSRTGRKVMGLTKWGGFGPNCRFMCLISAVVEERCIGRLH